MVNDSKISQWIEQGKQRGYSQKELEKMLLEKGFSRQEIRSALGGEKGKKLIIISAVIIAVLVIAVVAYSQISKISTETKSPSKGTGVQVSAEMQRCLNAGYTNDTCNAIISENVDSLANDCLALKISKEVCYDSAYLNIAAVKKDAKFCNKIISQELKGVCLERIK